MSVCGFDVGNDTSCVALARKRGIDVLMNKESKRETPAAINFGKPIALSSYEMINAVIKSIGALPGGRGCADLDASQSIQHIVERRERSNPVFSAQTSVLKHSATNGVVSRPRCVAPPRLPHRWHAGLCEWWWPTAHSCTVLTGRGLNDHVHNL